MDKISQKSPTIIQKFKLSIQSEFELLYFELAALGHLFVVALVIRRGRVFVKRVLVFPRLANHNHIRTRGAYEHVVCYAACMFAGFVCQPRRCPQRIFVLFRL